MTFPLHEVIRNTSPLQYLFQVDLWTCCGSGSTKYWYRTQ